MRSARPNCSIWSRLRQAHGGQKHRKGCLEVPQNGADHPARHRRAGDPGRWVVPNHWSSLHRGRISVLCGCRCTKAPKALPAVLRDRHGGGSRLQALRPQLRCAGLRRTYVRLFRQSFRQSLLVGGVVPACLSPARVHRSHENQNKDGEADDETHCPPVNVADRRDDSGTHRVAHTLVRGPCSRLSCRIVRHVPRLACPAFSKSLIPRRLRWLAECLHESNLADLTILAKLCCALARALVVQLAARGFLIQALHASGARAVPPMAGEARRTRPAGTRRMVASADGIG